MGDPTSSGHDLTSEFACDAELTDLIRYFVAGLPEKTRAVQRALDTADFDMLRLQAMLLAGEAHAYGFPRISDAAVEVQIGIRREPLNVDHYVADLIHLCGSVRPVPRPTV